MLILFMPIHNEMGRYLRPCLKWARDRVDEIFVWDDRSIDNGKDFALSQDAWVATRDDETPSFLSAEGSFRQAGWEYMIRTLRPTEDDWILALDADEFPVGAPPAGVARAAELEGYSSVELEKPEIFRLTPFSRRVDGYWANISEVRMVRFRPDLSQDFRKTSMGSGALPAYAYENPWFNRKMQLLHFGYAQRVDREEKHTRYLRKGRDSGHNTLHIDSILTPPVLEEWDGEIPDWQIPIPVKAKTS